MVRILGASYERVELKDLGDVVYYHQHKDYTEQQYESSRDLQREISKGRIIVHSRFSSAASSGETKTPVYTEAGPSLTLQDLKSTLRGMIPDLVEAVRQEVKQITPSTIYMNQSEAKISASPKFTGPEYIPDIDTKGMVSNIKSEEKKVSADDMNSALAALKNLNKI